MTLLFQSLSARSQTGPVYIPSLTGDFMVTLFVSRGLNTERRKTGVYFYEDLVLFKTFVYS